ncbi:MAG: prepilin-type N-terminal cleavage/methylation domain-containing protein [bacterium]|nr:prepilin-type N-terminal cleavage/methylation domain-containing protein [bacterium]
MKTSYKRGFTLIELLVVIAIIGILSSVVLASLNSARKKGRDARRVADVKQIQLALELYYDANSNYPTSLSGGLVSGGFISAVPTDPLSLAPYPYAALGSGTTCSSYHLGATIETVNHSALSADVDAPASTGICTGSGDDFEGTATQMYDVKP